jgi:hypothetical protein
MTPLDVSQEATRRGLSVRINGEKSRVTPAELPSGAIKPRR